MRFIPRAAVTAALSVTLLLPAAALAVTQDGIPPDTSDAASRAAFRQDRQSVIAPDFGNAQRVGLETMVVHDQAAKTFHFYDLSSLDRIATIAPAASSPTLSIWGYSGRYDAERFAVVVLNTQPSTASTPQTRTWNLRVYDNRGEFIYERRLARQVGNDTDKNKVSAFLQGDGYVNYTNPEDGHVAWSWAYRRIDRQEPAGDESNWLGNYTRFGSLNTLPIGLTTTWSFERGGENPIKWKWDYAAPGANTDSVVYTFTGSETRGTVVTTRDYLLFRRVMETKDTGEPLGEDLLVVNPTDGLVVKEVKILGAKKARNRARIDSIIFAADNTVVVSRTGMKDAAFDLSTGRTLWAESIDGTITRGGSGTRYLWVDEAPYGAILDTLTGTYSYDPNKKNPGRFIGTAGGWFFTDNPDKFIRPTGPVN